MTIPEEPPPPSILEAVEQVAAEWRRRQWRDRDGWWLVMPMRIKHEMVAQYGSVQAAFEALRQPGMQSPIVMAGIGAVGVEFVGADEHVERFRFPWAVQPSEGGASEEV